MTNRTNRTDRRRLVAGLCLAAVTLSTTAPLATARAQVPRRSGAVDGTWRAGGYGEVLDVRDGHLRVFQTSGTGCVRSQDGQAVGSTAGAVRFAIPDSDAVTLRRLTPRTAREHLESAVGDRRLTRLAALPTACSRPAPKGPVAVFDTLWSTFARQYPFFGLHGVDWDAMRARYRPQITARTTPAELFAVFGRMLAPLHDAHVALVEPEGQVFARVRPGTRIPTPALDARAKALATAQLRRLGASRLAVHAGGRIGFATLPGRIGYLRVSGFSGYTDADSERANTAELDRVLGTIFTRSRVASWRGLMIDLRVNGGGSDALALRLVRRLSDRPYLAYAKRYWRGRDWSAPQRITVVPHAGGYGGPLALLVSGSTVSAGETFTQALLGRPNRPVIVGERTQGVFSDTLDRVLPDGWTVSLPNEQYLTASGRAFDGTGVPPSIARPFTVRGPRDLILAVGYGVLRRR